jgi:hypothetical protein
MSLKRESAGVYVTHDGRYEVSKGQAFTDCYEPHPIRLSEDVRYAARYGTEEEKRAVGLHLLPFEARNAASAGERGYQCPGDQEHTYVSWGVWDREKDDYVADDSRHFDTKKAAVAWLYKHQERETAKRVAERTAPTMEEIFAARDKIRQELRGGTRKKLRAPGHKLTLTWSGETGIESSSTAECSCGWAEFASNQHECRYEYQHHLVDVLAKEALNA